MSLGKREQVAQAILDHLHMHDAEAGFQLPTIIQMSEMFMVAPETIRQAVGILKKEGVLEGRRGSGLFLKEQVRQSIVDKNIAVVFLNSEAYLDNDPYPGNIINSLRKRLAAAGLHMIACGMDLDESLIHYVQRLRELNIAGIILFEVFHPPLISTLHTLRLPMVSLDTDLSSHDIPSVIVDNRLGTGLATRELIQLGHQKIVFIGMPLKRNFNNKRFFDPVTEQRYDGYRLQMEMHGLPTHYVHTTHQEYRSQGPDALTSSVLAMKDRPTAVILDSDSFACEFIQSCARFGIGVPQDISVCGFGNIAVAYGDDKRVATIDVEWGKMGRIGAEHMIAQLKGVRDLDLQRHISVQLLAHDTLSRHAHDTFPDA